MELLPRTIYAREAFLPMSFLYRHLPRIYVPFVTSTEAVKLHRCPGSEIVSSVGNRPASGRELSGCIGPTRLFYQILRIGQLSIVEVHVVLRRRMADLQGRATSRGVQVAIGLSGRLHLRIRPLTCRRSTDTSVAIPGMPSRSNGCTWRDRIRLPALASRRIELRAWTSCR